MVEMSRVPRLLAVGCELRDTEHRIAVLLASIALHGFRTGSLHFDNWCTASWDGRMSDMAQWAGVFVILSTYRLCTITFDLPARRGENGQQLDDCMHADVCDCERTSIYIDRRPGRMPAVVALLVVVAAATVIVASQSAMAIGGLRGPDRAADESHRIAKDGDWWTRSPYWCADAPRTLSAVLCMIRWGV